MKKNLFIILLFFFVAPFTGHARPVDVARFDLSLFGYRLGMSYDQAASVRAFDYVTRTRQGTDSLPTFAGVIDGVYIDGLEVRVKAVFMNEQLFKVTGQFSPAVFEEMEERFKSAYGPAENASKLLEVQGGGTVRHAVYKWVFPGSCIFLVGSSANTKFATASLIAPNEISRSESSLTGSRVGSKNAVKE